MPGTGGSSYGVARPLDASLLSCPPLTVTISVPAPVPAPQEWDGGRQAGRLYIACLMNTLSEESLCASALLIF